MKTDLQHWGGGGEAEEDGTGRSRRPQAASNEIRLQQGGQGGHSARGGLASRWRSGESAKQSMEHDCLWRSPSEHPGNQTIPAKF